MPVLHFDGQAAAGGNGDAAAHAGLKQIADAPLFRQGQQLTAPLRHQLLVGGDHVLARGERGFEDLGRGVLAADELDHNVYGGVADRRRASLS